MERVIADRFVLERLVGSGGMGEVFRALDRFTGTPVAVKVIHASRIRDGERFRREAQILQDIVHQRIVRYVAHGVAYGRPYLVMEWLEGEDLGDRLEVEGLGLHDALTLARRTAEALAVFHAKGIVHRDIKPSNIFLPHRSVDEAKVLDLGVARLLGASRPTTKSGIMVGTPGYMAPEQARGAKELDERADIFSLGCVLYEAIVGRPAFVGDNIAALLAKILIETPPTLRESGIEVPAALDDLVRRMLSKHPDTRPASGGALLDELNGLAVDDAPPQRASARAVRAITAGERQLVCVVMAALPRTRDADSEPERLEDGTPISGFETLPSAFDPRAVVAAYGAEAEILADGSIVVTVSARGAASDQAAHAARCALALRAHLVSATVVLATGLVTMTGQSAVGEVLERAAAILAASRSEAREFADDTLTGRLGVLVDETTAGLLDTRFDIGGDHRGLFIRGLREQDTRPRTLLGKPTPFVGRDRELTTLRALLEECMSEPVARVALVTGFAGAGKSRLAAEFVRHVHEQNAEIWLARGDVMTEGSPNAIVARLLRRATGIVDGEPLVVRQQKLRARVARNVPAADVARVSEFLGEIMATPFDGAESVQLRAARHDPILLGDQSRRAFCDFVVAVSAAAPLVIVVEDLHWGDLPSVNLLDAALRAAESKSLMVLAVGRSEIHDAFPNLWRQRSLQEICLGPLVRRAGEQLVRGILGDVEPPELARLLDRAAGNVFYLEELIRAYAEGTGRTSRKSSYPPGTIPTPPTSSTDLGPAQAWALPTTVLAMVEARLLRLDPMARRILRAASVFGELFWRDGVLALTGSRYKEAQLDEWLLELSRREIVQRRDASRFPGDAEYTFMHSIVRDAAYQMLTPEDQELGHRLAAEWLERKGENEPMTLGEHFERGGARERAAQFYARAAFQALDGNDFAAAKDRAHRAIVSGAPRPQLDLLLAEAARWSGQHDVARMHAESAMRTLEPATDDWYVAAAERAESAITLGLVDEAREVGERLLEVAFGAPMTAARVIATSRVATSLGVVGLYDIAASLLGPIDEEEDFIASEPAARAFLLDANVARATRAGDLERAAVLAGDAVASFDLLGDVRNAARQRLSAGWALSELGAYDFAETVIREAAADAERLGLLQVTNDAKLRLGYSLVRSNRFHEGAQTILEAIDGFASQKDLVGEGRARAYLAGMFYFAGDFASAEDESKRALPLLEHSPPHRAALLGFMANAAVHLGRPGDEAVAMGAEAMRLLAEIGGVGEGEGVIRIGYAEALHYAGDIEGAREAIAAARTRLLARAEQISNPEHKASFLKAVREHQRTLARAGEWLP